MDEATSPARLAVDEATSPARLVHYRPPSFSSFMNQATHPLALNRRQALTTLAASFAAAISAKQSHASHQQSLVIDTHLHCFAGAQDSQFPYHSQAPYKPPRPAPPERLLQLMDAAGVDRAIVVHPEPYQDEHRYLEHCLDVGSGKLKGTCLFFADRPASLSSLRPFLKSQGDRIVAARLHAYAPDRLPPWSTPELDQLWRIATESNIAMQLHFEPRYAKLLDPYIRRYKETRIIIDHLGRPMQGTPEEYETVLSWSERPNTFMKFASLPDQNKYPHRDPSAIMNKLVQLWGPDRIIYGGGFSSEATPESYKAYREQIPAMLPELSDSDIAKIYGQTAAKLFDFT